MCGRMMVVVPLVMMFGFVAGCGKKSEETGVTSREEKAEKIESPRQKVRSKKMTDDMYVELAAQFTYIIGKHHQKAKQKNSFYAFGAVTDEWEKLYKKFGVTEEAYNDYSEQVSEDPVRFPELMERIAKRIEELQKAGK